MGRNFLLLAFKISLTRREFSGFLDLFSLELSLSGSLSDLIVVVGFVAGMLGGGGGGGGASGAGLCIPRRSQ